MPSDFAGVAQRLPRLLPRYRSPRRPEAVRGERADAGRRGDPRRRGARDRTRDARAGSARRHREGDRGAPTYEHGAFRRDPEHDLTARRAEAAMLTSWRENGRDGHASFQTLFKFFDDDVSASWTSPVQARCGG